MRKKVFNCLMVMCLFLFIGVSAHAEKGSVYVGLHGGFNVMQDIASGVVDEVGMKSGYACGASLGYMFKNVEGANLRLEIEAAYRKNDTDTWREFDMDGEVTSQALMLNAGVDFVNKTRFTPVVLIGVGRAKVTFNDFSIYGMQVLDDEDSVFAYQAGIGCAVNLTERLVLDLGYRYFATSKVTMTDDAGVTGKNNYQNHNLMLGMRFHF